MRVSTGRIVSAIVTLLAAAPQAAAQTSATPLEPVAHIYRQVDGAALKLHVFSPAAAGSAAKAPAILLFHGGGWSVGAADWTFASARRYAGLGMVAISVEYRLSNDKVTPIDALDDVCRAYEWVRSEAAMLRIDPQRVAAAGVSAGGHLSAAAATIGCGNNGGTFGNGGPDALVLWSPALDVSQDGHFQRLLLGRGKAEAYSPSEHVRPRMPPVHIVIGERDTLTPLGHARRFCDRVIAGGGRCELSVYPNVGHLLTRNLADQENDFDPDPVARDDGNAKQLAFMRSLWMP